jgi:MFS family permease
LNLVFISSDGFPVTAQEASWVASLSLLGALFGGALAGVALRCGRRRVLLVCAVPFSASWLLTVFATSVEMMFATAFAGGFCCALVLLVTQVRPHSFAPSVLWVPHSLPRTQRVNYFLHYITSN